MKTILRPAITLFLLLSVLTGMVYPLAVTVIAQIFFPSAANGSLLEKDGKVVGSALIGQNFSGSQYFWGRPSATAPYPNNGVASGGSNMGPLNPALAEAVKARINALREADPANAQPVPIDLVTSSASGLDPEISPAAAEYQIKRVAKARNLNYEQLHQLVIKHTDSRLFGFLGEARVNVLALNLDLDAELK